MKLTTIFCSIFLLTITASCEKNPSLPSKENNSISSQSENHGPYKNFSRWKSIGGDTIFSDTLTLTFFYREKAPSCDICYYQQNYPLWNDYDYTFSISACAKVNDTLIIKNPDKPGNAIFTILN